MGGRRATLTLISCRLSKQTRERCDRPKRSEIPRAGVSALRKQMGGTRAFFTTVSMARREVDALRPLRPPIQVWIEWGNGKAIRAGVRTTVWRKIA